MKSLKIPLFTVFAIILAVVGIQHQAVGQQDRQGATERAIPQREPLIGLDKLIPAYKVQLIDAHTLMALVRAQRENNQPLLEILKAFQQDEIDASTLKRRVAEVIKSEYTQQLNSRLCEDFADGYEIGCMLNGGLDCREQADAMYCACLGGYNAGGGFCLTYN